MFKENLEKDPQKKCIYFEDKAWTYEMVNQDILLLVLK